MFMFVCVCRQDAAAGPCSSLSCSIILSNTALPAHTRALSSNTRVRCPVTHTCYSLSFHIHTHRVEDVNKLKQNCSQQVLDYVWTFQPEDKAAHSLVLNMTETGLWACTERVCVCVLHASILGENYQSMWLYVCHRKSQNTGEEMTHSPIQHVLYVTHLTLVNFIWLFMQWCLEMWRHYTVFSFSA